LDQELSGKYVKEPVLCAINTEGLGAVVLYEGEGIDLYEAITRESSYYLYRDELSLIQQYSDEIVRFPFEKKTRSSNEK